MSRAGTVLLRIGAPLLTLLIAVALFAPLLTPYDSMARTAAPFEPPSWAHPLGANDIGQDLLSELIVGARISLLVGCLAALVATILGTAVGLAAGFFRGAIDTVLMRLVDAVLVFPFLPLTIVLGVFFGPGIATEIFVISALSWTHTARELRAQVLSTRERGYLQAARAMGASGLYALARHILPTVSPLLVSQFVRAISGVILLETSLSFLGLGDPTAKSWGTILYYANARSAFLTDAWLWWVLPAGVVIALTLLSVALIGYALEERLRPRLRSGWSPGPRQGRGARSLSIERPPPDVPVLAIEGLTVEYAGTRETVRAVDDVSLVVRRGEIVGVVGESGSGKSTVGMAVLRLIKPPGSIRSGEICLARQNMLALSNEQMARLRGARVALVPQAAMNALNPVFSVGDQIVEAIVTHRGVGREVARRRAEELLALVGLDPARGRDYPHELSGGMRQRAAIAMALANDPWLLVADEPTTGLDLLIQADVLSLLKELSSRLDLAVLLISHDIGAVAQVADQIAVMQAGRIIEQGPATAIVRRPAHEYTRRLLASLPRLSVPASSPPFVASARDGQEPLLEVVGLAKSYPSRVGERSRTVLAGVDLTIGVGEIVGLIGASGVGKSTIARLLFGLTLPDRGTMTYEGVDLRAWGRWRRRARRQLQLIFQDPYDSLPPHMRIWQVVSEPLAIHGLADRRERHQRALAVLDEVELRPAARFVDRYPHELSGGERQRVALARALVLKPRLIVADEPTSMLDASIRAELLRLMRDFRDRHGIAYLYITHDLALASSFCDRLLVLHDGVLVESGPTDVVIHHPRHPYTGALVRAAAALELPELEAVPAARP